VFFWVGITPRGEDLRATPDNHSDRFYVDESGIAVGLRSMLHVAVDYLQDSGPGHGSPSPEGPAKVK
jgi:amidohydrolase